jgi:tetratricopeptide (TPR) repeat protein
MSKEHFQVCDRIAAIALSATVLLGIFAFVPGGVVSSAVLKGYILVIGVAVAFIAWLVGRLMERTVRIPRTWIFPALALFALVIFLSAFFSHAPYLSFFGERFDAGAFIPLAALSLALFLASMLFQGPKRTPVFLSGAFVLYVLIGIYQFVHVFFPEATSFGIFSSNVSSVVGQWSDFAYLSGAALVSAVLILQFFRPSSLVRKIIVFGGALGLFFVMLANVLTVWILTGLALFGIVLYVLLSKRDETDRRFPIVPFILTVVAIFFVFANARFGGMLADAFDAPYTGLTPSASSTLHVAGESIAKHPVLGIGPNRFFHQWLTYRPISVNASILWDTSFSFGSSFFLTVGVLSGVLGLLATLALVIALCYQGIKTLRASLSTSAFSMLVLAFYFVAMLVVSAPGISLVICAFFFIGLFLALLVTENGLEQKTIALFANKGRGVITVVVTTLIVVCSLAVIVGATGRVLAEGYYRAGLSAAVEGDILRADAHFTRAIRFVDLPSYERARVMLAAQSVQTVVEKTSGQTELSEADKNLVQQAITIGNTSALRAITLDSSDVQNYIVYGDFMRALGPLELESAFGNARDSYLQAIAAAPDYPKSYINMAELYFDQGDMVNGEKYLDQALAKKSNYADALFLKGFLYYQKNEYTKAAETLRTATELDSENMNAWYYLAKSFALIGNTKEASMIFTALHAKYPDNENINNALRDLSLVNQ